VRPMKTVRTIAFVGASAVLALLATSTGAQPGPGSGSGSDAGSAAPIVEAGSGSGSAAPAKLTKVAEASCADAKYVVDNSFAITEVVPDPTRNKVFNASTDIKAQFLEPYDIEVNDVIKFDLKDHDVVPDPTASDINLKAVAGKVTCLQVVAPGTFGWHTSTGNLHGKVVAKPWYQREAERPVREAGNFWMPKAVNSAADDSDLLFMSVLGMSAFFFFAITAAVVYFVVKYRHKPGRKPEPSAGHNDALEITWTIIPTIITVFLFWYGWKSYVKVVTPPTAAVEIAVTAQRWTWEFKHSNGVKDVDLHVPVGTPVRLVMTSTDVLHSFYAPVMRVKQDIVPKRYTYAWFIATKPGTYRLNCAEYCGTNHSQMGIQDDGRRAVVVVEEPGKYERYLADKDALEKNLPPEELGKLLYDKKGCVGCHTIDGSARIGPSFFHDFGTKVGLSDGRTINMDETYIKRSLMSPQAESRPGYPATMPSFEGTLKESEIQGIIAFIKSLK
jgi:cytochrome c oxidase subunit 2